MGKKKLRIGNYRLRVNLRYAVSMNHLLPAILLICLFTLPDPLAATEKALPYLRAVEGQDGVALQTCIRRLLPESGTGPVIILAATSHVGSANYYAALQNHINQQPLVLFEGAGVPDFLRLDPPATVDVALINKERVDLLTEWLGRFKEKTGNLPENFETLTEWVETVEPGHAWMILRTASLPGQVPLRLGVSPEMNPQLEAADDRQTFKPVVLPENLNHSKPDRSTLQRDLARALGLKFQLDAICMSSKNCYPCDMTRSEMAAVLAAAAEPEPGETMDPKRREKQVLAQDLDGLIDLMQGKGIAGKLAMFGVALIGMSEPLQQGCLLTLAEIMNATGGDLVAATRDPRVKRLMELLLKERNELVLQALNIRLTAREHPRSITLFYGAGHMLELENSIRERFAYQMDQEAWLTVYTADPDVPGFTPEHRQQIRDAVMEQMTTDSKN